MLKIPILRSKNFRTAIFEPQNRFFRPETNYTTISSLFGGSKVEFQFFRNNQFMSYEISWWRYLIHAISSKWLECKTDKIIQHFSMNKGSPLCVLFFCKTKFQHRGDPLLFFEIFSFCPWVPDPSQGSFLTVWHIHSAE